ncbi:MAG: hypothetical protein J6Y32_08585 [Bacteroidales bacterium]|nr:hypothetical protein [Bacteroidales bacterium]
MAEKFILNQIPGFEIGAVEHIRTTDEVQALFLAAQEISELLNQWNTNVGFFSLSSRSEGLKALVDNKSSVARLYTVNQKNHDLNVILRKAQGMVNRKFVRAIVIEGLPGKLEDTVQRRLEEWAKSNQSTIVLASVVEESYFDEFLNL